MMERTGIKQEPCDKSRDMSGQCDIWLFILLCLFVIFCVWVRVGGCVGVLDTLCLWGVVFRYWKYTVCI